MSMDFNDYKAAYEAQTLRPDASGGTFWQYLGFIYEDVFAGWLHPTNPVFIILIIILILFLIYSIYVGCSMMRCPTLCTFTCVCPCLSLNRMKERFERVRHPGLLRLAPGKVEAYPIDEGGGDIEKAMIERISKLMKAEIPEVGDGA